MNKAILSGRLARDPELRQTTTGKNVCSFTIATAEKNTQFIDCDAWGELGVNISRFLKKGSQAFVEGVIQNSSYEENGKKRTRTKVVATNVEFGLKAKQEPKDEFVDFPF